MASLKTVLYLGVCLSVWIITTADKNFVPAAEEVHWISLDFKTTLFWTTKASKYTYTVKYFSDDHDWMESLDCIRVSHSECDLSNSLRPFDRSYYADILTEPATMDHDYDLDEFPHTYSPHFNPYRETNISAVKFTVEVVDESRVIVNITDPLTSIHERGKQLSIRDILKSDLKYKISYYKSGSTGKRDIMSDSSTAVVSGLDAGQSYCFMVAAFIPSRPQTTQNGAWSTQRCTNGHIMQELSLGAWVGVVFILLIVLIIIITVTVLCCRCCRRRNKTLHTSQSSAPV
ncbi:tissue factor-like isoform X1 [Micropterus salmoides]|uniref:tissue factor-like isoform X1 n=1 Tax=Micropterus salmoides TaxID=27706 RepID=UPI0018EB94B7|nr:tissue factor-like isoform X1 [Micropterus salmoides]